MIGPICGVVAGVLVLALLTGLLVWRRKRGAVQTITMRQLIEDGEARGTLLEENEVGPSISLSRTQNIDMVLSVQLEHAGK